MLKCRLASATRSGISLLTSLVALLLVLIGVPALRR
jgi:Tfp pilus assembly protein PilV